jgi:hypothetical protein
MVKIVFSDRQHLVTLDGWIHGVSPRLDATV